MDISLYEQTLINLIKCGINDAEIKSLDNSVNLELLCIMSKTHSLINIIYEPLVKANILKDEIKEKLTKYYNAGIANDSLQMYYLDLITDSFEKNKIPHCVMKGPILKKLYPKSDFRQSGDIDIYVPETYREKAKDVMLSLRFEIERYELENADDVYFIPNKVHVELHRVLISNKTPWQNECQKITDRLVLADGKEYSYEMTVEDYYLYMIAHMAKHMKYSGMGIKMVLDVWIYLKKYEGMLDWNILNDRLSACGLCEFEKNVKKLVEYWFEDKDADEITLKLARYVFVSGTFGTDEQLNNYFYLENAGKAHSDFTAKFKYFWNFFFQPYDYMSKNYPILKKIPVLLPYFWIQRAINAFLFKKEKAKQVLTRYNNINMDNAKKTLDFKKEIGL